MLCALLRKVKVTRCREGELMFGRGLEARDLVNSTTQKNGKSESKVRIEMQFAYFTILSSIGPKYNLRDKFYFIPEDRFYI